MVVAPLGSVCPPDNGNDDEHAIQIELLRQIVTTLIENRRDDEDREQQELLTRILEAIREGGEVTIPIPIPIDPVPSTSRTITFRTMSSGWRPRR